MHKALVVDDSKTTRLLTTRVLNDMGIHLVEEAVDGLDAISRAGAFKPDLILLDWNMPVMTGYEFLEKYRQGGGGAKIIMITTEAEKGQVVKAVQAGVDGYILKPFTGEQLRGKIEGMMGGRGRKAG